MFKIEKTDKKACFRCGKNNHKQEFCFFKNKKCFRSKKIGHNASVCKSKKEFNNNINLINYVAPFYAKCKAFGNKFNMEIDTRSAVTLINKNIFNPCTHIGGQNRAQLP